MPEWRLCAARVALSRIFVEFPYVAHSHNRAWSFPDDDARRAVVADAADVYGARRVWRRSRNEMYLPLARFALGDLVLP